MFTLMRLETFLRRIETIHYVTFTSLSEQVTIHRYIPRTLSRQAEFVNLYSVAYI